MGKFFIEFDVKNSDFSEWRPPGGKHVVLSSFVFFRYFLRKKLENGKRNGLQLTGDELEEFKLVKKISELGIAFLLCLKSSFKLSESSHCCNNLASGLV